MPRHPHRNTDKDRTPPYESRLSWSHGCQGTRQNGPLKSDVQDCVCVPCIPVQKLNDCFVGKTTSPAGLAPNIIYDEQRPARAGPYHKTAAALWHAFCEGKQGVAELAYATAWKLCAYGHPVLNHQVVIMGDPSARIVPKGTFSISLVPLLCSLKHLGQFAT